MVYNVIVIVWLGLGLTVYTCLCCVLNHFYKTRKQIQYENYKIISTELSTLLISNQKVSIINSHVQIQLTTDYNWIWNQSTNKCELIIWGKFPCSNIMQLNHFSFDFPIIICAYVISLYAPTITYNTSQHKQKHMN